MFPLNIYDTYGKFFSKCPIYHRLIWRCHGNDQDPHAMRQGHWANNSASTLLVFCCGQIPKSHWLMKVLLHVSWWIFGEVGWDVWVSRMQVVEQICAMFCAPKAYGYFWFMQRHCRYSCQIYMQVFFAIEGWGFTCFKFTSLDVLINFLMCLCDAHRYTLIQLIDSIYIWFHPIGIFVGVLIVYLLHFFSW